MQALGDRIEVASTMRVLNMSVDETASILVHCPTWVRDRLRHYDEGGLEGLRDLSRCGRPRRHCSKMWIFAGPIQFVRYRSPNLNRAALSRCSDADPPEFIPLVAEWLTTFGLPQNESKS